MTEQPCNPNKLDDWQNALIKLADQIEQWSKKQNWLCHREQKQIQEEQTGVYEVPTLTVETNQGRIRVDPYGLNIIGGCGRVDIYAWPNLTQVLLIDYDQGCTSMNRTKQKLSAIGMNKRSLI